ncbi:hypothetical protein LY78DRAFT_148138 [Colletotrichum sublineola]|nr:hypothetical protein LY78DRAFT_148138 [Colletotrichum sublineola]
MHIKHRTGGIQVPSFKEGQTARDEDLQRCWERVGWGAGVVADPRHIRRPYTDPTENACLRDSRHGFIVTSKVFLFYFLFLPLLLRLETGGREVDGATVIAVQFLIREGPRLRRRRLSSSLAIGSFLYAVRKTIDSPTPFHFFPLDPRLRPFFFFFSFVIMLASFVIIGSAHSARRCR